MVKHAATIRRLLPMNFFSVFDHFVGLAVKGLRPIFLKKARSFYKKAEVIL